MISSGSPRFAAWVLLAWPLVAGAATPPILDMHLHARAADYYNNAARFLRLTEAEIARHHGMGRPPETP